MPKGRNGEIPLPEGWELGRDYDGKVYFIDHKNKKTTWVDPRDKLIKPQTFADCVGNELPLGWEEAFDPQVGVYYINHIIQTNQLEDPRLEWRKIQEAMLKDYLLTAKEDLEAKKEILDIKQQRLNLAQEEFNHLNLALVGLSSSRTSLNSISSTSSTKFDPDLLKADLVLAKNRVSRLRRELEQVKAEMVHQQRGVEALAKVDQKLSGVPTGYTLTEAQAILAELNNIQRSLSSGEKEKAELMVSLVRLRDDLIRLPPLSTNGTDTSPDLSTLSLPTEKLSTASQTDLSGDLVPVGARLAEMARKRLEYDEARKAMQIIQKQLADLEERINPGESESDKDRILLIQEKEQLVRELRSISPRLRSKEEMESVQAEILRLQRDLSQAWETSNRTIADRLKLHEEKQALLQSMREAIRVVTLLEGQLRSLSASTLSMSSSSSLGSLSNSSHSHASSKGSLASALSFTDIYGPPHLSALNPVSSTYPNPILAPGHSLAELNQRVERLLLQESQGAAHRNKLLLPPGQSQTSLSPRSSLSSVSASPPISPYDMVLCDSPYANINFGSVHNQSNPLESMLNPLSLHDSPNSHITSNFSHQDWTEMPLYSNLLPRLPTINLTRDFGVNSHVIEEEPLYENPATLPRRLLSDLNPLSPIPETLVAVERRVSSSASSGVHTRPMSAAVSSESMTGDSGVFEASTSRREHLSNASTCETGQIQIRLKYDLAEEFLHIGIEKARHLRALNIVNNSRICVKASLLPSPADAPLQCSTQALQITDVENCSEVKFDETFRWAVPSTRLHTKTLQLVFCCKPSDQEQEFVVGCIQVSLADFQPDTQVLRWYNVLAMPRESRLLPAASTTCIKEDNVEDKSWEGSLSRLSNAKEESSDESTIISSQTSTLTRNQRGFELVHEDSDEEDDEDQEQEENIGPTDICSQDQFVEDTLEMATDTAVDNSECIGEESDSDTDDMRSRVYQIEVIMDQASPVDVHDKETNTECVFIPERGLRKNVGTAPTSRAIVIKRSQTFSPSAAITRANYICRLNRSDSDSSMPLYRKNGGPFQRNSIERRSLRWRTSMAAFGSLNYGLATPSNFGFEGPLEAERRGQAPKSMRRKPPPLSRTSIDLELDYQAQQKKLEELQEELERLRGMKLMMEKVRGEGAKEMPAWIAENEQLQTFLTVSESMSGTKTVEDRKLEKMLRRTSRELYRLRKTRASRGQLDTVSFKEKMAFLARPHMQVPLVIDQSEENIPTTVTDPELPFFSSSEKSLKDSVSAIPSQSRVGDKKVNSPSSASHLHQLSTEEWRKLSLAELERLQHLSPDGDRKLTLAELRKLQQLAPPLYSRHGTVVVGVANGTPSRPETFPSAAGINRFEYEVDLELGVQV